MEGNARSKVICIIVFGLAIVKNRHVEHLCSGDGKFWLKQLEVILLFIVNKKKNMKTELLSVLNSRCVALCWNNGTWVNVGIFAKINRTLTDSSDAAFTLPPR